MWAKYTRCNVFQRLQWNERNWGEKKNNVRHTVRKHPSFVRGDEKRIKREAMKKWNVLDYDKWSRAQWHRETLLFWLLRDYIFSHRNPFPRQCIKCEKFHHRMFIGNGSRITHGFDYGRAIWGKPHRSMATILFIFGNTYLVAICSSAYPWRPHSRSTPISDSPEHHLRCVQTIWPTSIAIPIGDDPDTLASIHDECSTGISSHRTIFRFYPFPMHDLAILEYR